MVTWAVTWAELCLLPRSRPLREFSPAAALATFIHISLVSRNIFRNISTGYSIWFNQTGGRRMQMRSLFFDFPVCKWSDWFSEFHHPTAQWSFDATVNSRLIQFSLMTHWRISIIVIHNSLIFLIGFVVGVYNVRRPDIFMTFLS